jgi:uncharacterized membrane protein YfhO
VELLTVSTEPAVLRIAERYDPAWIATIDGKAATLVRVDYMFQGVPVPAGAHYVLLEYRPSMLLLKVQIAGMLLCVLAAVFLAIRSVMEKRREP